MHKAMQKSLLESLLVNYGGDISSAYADLVEQVTDGSVISESLAAKWAKGISDEARKAEGSRQLAKVIAGDRDLGTRVVDFSHLNPDQQHGAFDDEFKRFAYTLVSDHGHEIFEPKERVAGIPKVAELMGTPIRLQSAGKSTPQAAHRAVQHVASVFGTLTDRQVLITFVQDGQDVGRATNTLKALDPSLAYLTPETVSGKLREWQRRGVVMDADGTVVEWGEAIAGMTQLLRTLPAASESDGY